MNSDLSPFSGQAIISQAKVLADTRLSDQTKLFFCSLMCNDTIRSGWGIGKPTWTSEEVHHLETLDYLGYLRVEDDEVGHTAFLALSAGGEE